MPRPIGQRLAEYFEGQAYFLASETEPYPRSADALDELARYVRELPADDERLLMLDALDRGESDPYTPWDSSAALRFRASSGNETCDEFLTRFARAQEAGIAEALEDGTL